MKHWNFCTGHKLARFLKCFLTFGIFFGYKMFLETQQVRKRPNKIWKFINHWDRLYAKCVCDKDIESAEVCQYIVDCYNAYRLEENIL